MDNPIAQMRKPITVEDVLNARADRPASGPARRAATFGRRRGHRDRRPRVARSLGGRYVDVVGRGFHHEGVHQVSPQPRSLTWFESAEIASNKAYKAAGITAADAGLRRGLRALLDRGADPERIASAWSPAARAASPPSKGVTSHRRPDPHLPVRAAARSRGHPPLVTPLYNVYEAVQQLRGEAGEPPDPSAPSSARSPASSVTTTRRMMHILRAAAEDVRDDGDTDWSIRRG